MNDNNAMRLDQSVIHPDQDRNGAAHTCIEWTDKNTMLAFILET